MVRLKAPANGGSVSFQGREYAVRKGVIEVPDAAVETLKAHGYQPVFVADEPAAVAPSPVRSEGA